MANNGFPTLNKEELKRLSPVAASQRIVQAVKETRRELRRQDKPATIADACKVLDISPSTYNGRVNHLYGVEVYGFSPRLTVEEVHRRLKLMDDTPQRLAHGLDGFEDTREDAEILADAVSAVLIRAGEELAELDAGVLVQYLRRDPMKRGGTKSALTDLIPWLQKMERAL